MRLKSAGKRFMIIFSAVLIFVFNSSVGATEQTARLKYSIENDHMYLVLTPDVLGSSFAANKSSFKANYDGSYVAVSGLIKYSSLQKKGSIIVYGDTKNVEVDTSAVSGIASKLTLGDTVVVYGKVDVSGAFNKSFEIEAEHMDINPEEIPSPLSSVFYQGRVYKEEMISDLAKDGHVHFYLPSEWKNDYVMGRLTNNDVNGYQFFLNAISPQNRQYPENFYMFYFGYENYLDKPPVDPTNGDRKDIEKLIMSNILGGLSGDFDDKIEKFELPNGKELHYCSTVYKPADGNDYRLEFFFKNDATGIVCMLYLYYPNDGAVNHIRDVSYVIQTLMN